MGPVQKNQTASLPGDLELLGNQLPELAFQHRKGSSAMTEQPNL